MSEEIKLVDNEKQVSYKPASDNCQVLNTVVPKSMAIEQQKFNDRLRIEVGDVDEYVAKKLRYANKDSLCLDKDEKAPDLSKGRTGKFSAEQIDAIATAIWNHENNGDAIIIADQTGVGKGRIGAGLLRYAYFEKKKIPLFFTEKKHLVNDIFRDLRDIGFDVGVSIGKYEKVKVDKVFTEKDILIILLSDLKKLKGNDISELKVDYSFPDDDEFNINFLIDYLKGSELSAKAAQFDIEGLAEDLKERYEQEILTNGIYKTVVTPKSEFAYQQELDEELEKGKVQFRPFLLNSDSFIYDGEGNIYYEKISTKEYEAIYRKNDFGKFDTITFDDIELPSKFKMIGLPYSQISSGVKIDLPNGGSVDTAKGILLKKYSLNSLLVMDEAHNASGINSTGVISKTGEFIRVLMNYSSMVTFISATFSKRAENMPLYASKTSVREANLMDDELVNLFRTGGNSLQESVAAELVRNGQLIRREKLIEGEPPLYLNESLDSQNGMNQIAKLNRVAPVFIEIREFADKVKKAFKDVMEDVSEDDKKKYTFGGNVNRLTFNLFNFFLLGLKVNQTISEAISNLKNGKKTVITVASTMESALNNFKKDYLSTSKNENQYKVGDEVKNDFSLYMLYLIRYCLTINKIEQVVDDAGRIELVPTKLDIMTSEDVVASNVYNEVKEEYSKLINEISRLYFGISISPIDSIKNGIANAGYKIDEITGRQRQIVFKDGDQSVGIISSRKIPKVEDVVSKFNNNELDCLIINQSGATGISLHAKPTEKVNIVYDNAPTTLDNKQEVKARAMIITQMELDINKEVQKLGRINRTGQVYQPSFTYLTSVIPSEARLNAMMEKKLRSLSANVNADQNQSNNLFESEDFFSDIAIDPCNKAIDATPDFKVEKVKTAIDIYNLTKLLYFINFDTQRIFYEKFTSFLNEEITSQIEMGTYKGKMSFKDYSSVSLEKYPFFLGNNDAKTSFGGHSVLEKCEVTMFENKNLEFNIKNKIQDFLDIKFYDENYNVKTISYSSVDKYKEEFLKLIELELKKEADSSSKNADKYNTLNLGLSEEIKKLKEGLSKYNDLEKAIEIENEVKSKNSLIKEKQTEISTAASEGDMEKLTSLGAEIKSIKDELAPLQEKLTKYEDILTKKSEFKEVLKEIKDKEDEIESNNRYNERMLKRLDDIKNNVLKIKEFLDLIGVVSVLKTSEEESVWDTTESKINYSYKEIKSDYCVVTKFSVDFTSLNLNAMSNFTVGLATITETENLALSKFLETSAERKPLYAIKSLGYSYENSWNKIAGKVDTSYKGVKYIAYGSMLSTFKLTSNNGYNGSVIKYSTKEGAIRIGIEIENRLLDERAQKYLYDEINSRYSSNLAYPIYFSTNPHNVKRYINDYLNSATSDVYFEILTSSGETFIKFNPYSDYCSVYSQKGLNSKLITDLIYSSFKRNGLHTDYEYNKNSVFAKSNPSNLFSGTRRIYGLGTPFVQFFPCSITNVKYSSEAFVYDAILEIYKSDFFKFLEMLYDKKIFPSSITLTLTTSNKYFEQFKEDYIFEQFKDDILKIEETASGVDFVDEANGNSKIELIAEKLIKLLQ